MIIAGWVLRSKTWSGLLRKLTGLNPANTSIAAFLGLNNAHDWESFRAAVRLCTAAPVNFGYADAQGNFGFHSAGMVPIRARGNGSAPAAGWTGEHEWTGYIPCDELPHAFNPAEGYLILISTAPPDPEYPYLLTTDWVEPYRRERIREFITSKMNLSGEDHAALQADTISLFARRALPVMLPLAASKDEPTRAALALLKDRDYDACGGRFINAGAQCGHFLARRGDYMRDWASNRYRPMRFDRDSVERNAAGTLLLEPSRTP
jgi:penicillin amidase